MTSTLRKTITLDRDLARRASRKFRHYGHNFDEAVSYFLTVAVSHKGNPFAEWRPPVPSVIEFEANGEHFVADVTPDGDSYSAQVRNHPECYTCGDTEAELRKNLVEAAELAIFDIADKEYA